GGGGGGWEGGGGKEPLHTRFAEPLPRIPLVWGPTNFEKLSEQIGEITEKGQPLWWWPAFLITSALLCGGVLAATYLISTGVGVWGSNGAVGGGVDVTNFGFCLALAHAGTLCWSNLCLV